MYHTVLAWGSSFTGLVAVLPIRTLHTFKAAGGLPFNDPLPGPCQAVPAAVGEGHLEDRRYRSDCGSSDLGDREELGTRIRVAGRGPFQAEEGWGPRFCYL